MGSPPRTIRAVLARCCFKLPDREFEFSNQPVWFVLKKFLQQSPIVPKRTLAPACEPLPDYFSDFAIVGKNGAHIVQLVRGGNQPGVRVGIFQMLDVGLFAFPPWWFGICVGIRAAIDNFGHAAPEAPPDLLQHGRAATVLDHIVKQRRDRQIFVSAELQHQRRDSHQVRDIRNRRGLSRLPRMLLRRKIKCSQESWAKLHRLLLDRRRLRRFHAHYCFSPRRTDKYARINGCKSPSSTRSTSPTSV